MGMVVEDLVSGKEEENFLEGLLVEGRCLIAAFWQFNSMIGICEDL